LTRRKSDLNEENLLAAISQVNLCRSVKTLLYSLAQQNSEKPQPNLGAQQIRQVDPFPL
jgi:hypothetical protein